MRHYLYNKRRSKQRSYKPKRWR